jgi:D-alanyl-D-alanine carboxypeptidase/D-alanyl-D-alanine-endopeptidase (penicillin-binding protein 4)
MSAPAEETVAFRMMLNPGQAEAYRQRHDAIWPELSKALIAAGVVDYRIWLDPESHHLFAVLRRRIDHTLDRLPETEVMQRWWRERVGGDMPTFDNGSGLSREERISAQALARLLQVAWASPNMSELMSSLPVTGLDGTMKRSKAQASAHLKTGSLRDVAGVAGFVDTASGKRLVVVAILHHANANAARPALDAMIDWAGKQP